MKEFKGTKGEWHAVSRSGFLKILNSPYAEGRNVLDFIEVGITAAQANATLICASQDLLQAAIDFVDKVESGKAKSTDSYNKFKAAINKALGE